MYKWKVQAEYRGSGVEDAVAEILKNRDILDVDNFLNPPSVSHYLKNLPREFKLSLKKARDLIFSALEESIPIVIHGDYDSDGICATAILYNTLKKELGYNHTYFFIPNRFDHGYGISVASLEASLEMVKQDLERKGVNHKESKVLFISVDSGITAVEPVKYAKGLGHSVIITDHHQKPEILPAADCIVWNDEVVGASVSWILSRALGSKNNQSIAFAGLATVTDLQPVLGFNRAILKEGLGVMNSMPPLGLLKLFEVSGRGGAEVSAYDLGWVVGPRLNASGRIEDAAKAVNLFITSNEQEAEEIAQNLNQINIERQDKTLEMYELAENTQTEGEMPKILFSHHEDYHEGIIGLVASKLVQKFYRPAIVMTLLDGQAKGSVRSVEGVDIISFLRRYEDLFINVGGHPMAAGFTIALENIEILKQKMLEDASELIPDELLKKILSIDLEIPANLISLEMVDSLEKMKPFGIGNEEPIFCTKDMGVVSVKTIGRENNHLLFKLYKDDRYFKAIFFGGVEKGYSINFGDRIDVAYTLSKNEFNGTVTIDMILKDVKILA